MTKIQHSPPNNPIHPVSVPKGDVSRELIEALDLITTIVVPRSLKGVSLPKKEGTSTYFANAKGKMLPVGGKVHRVANQILTKQGRAENFPTPHSHPPKRGYNG